MSPETGPSTATEQFVGIEWTARVVARLTDPLLCPVCMSGELNASRCENCAVDLSGENGAELWRVSQAATESLKAREQLLRSSLAGTVSLVADSRSASPHAADQASIAVPSEATKTSSGTMPPAMATWFDQAEPSGPGTRSSNVTVQSMFALAGAGLVAVAAIVFTFFNPDLDDRVLRSSIVAAATLLFLGGAWWLAKRGSASSAEIVGGLAAVFVGIDVWALAQSADEGRDAWLLAAIATLLCASAAFLLSRQIGLRSWLFASMLGFALVPAMLGYSADAQLAAVLGHLGLVFVVAAQFEWLPTFMRIADYTNSGEDAEAGQLIGASPRSDRRLPVTGRAERILLSTLQIVAALSSIPILGASLGFGESTAVGALLLGFAAVAVFAARHTARNFWSLVAGASAAAVLPAISFGAHLLGSWQLTLLTAGATLGAVLVVAFAPRLRSTSLPLLSFASISVPAVFSLPTMLFVPTLFSSATRGAEVFTGSAEISWSFVVNALILSSGAAMCARFAARNKQKYPSMKLLSGLCLVLATLFALCAAFMLAQILFGILGLDGKALQSVVVSVGLMIAVGVTLAHRTPVLVWFTVLAATTVPFVASIAMVIEQRSGWTALTTACMCGLALTLLATKRPGTGALLRAIAAAMLVPSLAVLTLCLGAEILKISASPVVLPVIATLVALALATSKQLFALVPSHARFARLAFEASTLVTAAITVLLAFTREAAGLGTACIVLILLGLGAAMFARLGGRQYGWWLAGLSFTGALWCALGLVKMEVFEAYLLPPALGASILAAWLTIRGSRQIALYSVGLAAAILPVLALITQPGEASTVRAIALLIGSWLLLVVARVLLRGRDAQTAATSLAMPTLTAAMTAGLAGTVFAANLGFSGVPFGVCLMVSAVGAGAMFLAGNSMRIAVPSFAEARWPEAPAVVAFAAGCWWAIDRNWVDIWSMWALMAAYLMAMIVVTRRQLAGSGPRIPALLLFVVALVTAIVAWSPRDLRVDVFSLPLGLMLTLAGALVLQHHRRLGKTAARETRAGGVGQNSKTDAAAPGDWRPISRWPLGKHGSWALLGPGITVTVLASIIATFTDPQTWRAILVMTIALIAMLLGAWLRLAAPFLIGLIVLPVENVFVFMVQIGRGIDSMPWWITLATIGAVLLSIAVVSEQRSGGQPGLMARMRDLS